MDDMTVPGLDSEMRSLIYDHVFSNDDHEVGGILVGRLGNDSLPVVTGMIAALEADGQRASVTFTHEAWAKIHATMDRDFVGEQIVGWYHSHPGFGIFLSKYDRFIHDNFFSDPRQIAYVVDPHAGTEGVFHWDHGDLELLWEGPADRPGTAARVRREALARRDREIDPEVPAPPAALMSRAATQEQRRAAALVVAVLFIVLVAAVILTGSPSTPVPTSSHHQPPPFGSAQQNAKHSSGHGKPASSHSVQPSTITSSKAYTVGATITHTPTTPTTPVGTATLTETVATQTVTAQTDTTTQSGN